MYANAKYFKGPRGDVAGIQVEINGSICWVPIDPANSDYQNIMALVEKGELVIAPADE